jgi:hypothetical protein
LPEDRKFFHHFFSEQVKSSEQQPLGTADSSGATCQPFSPVAAFTQKNALFFFAQQFFCRVDEFRLRARSPRVFA